MINKNSFKINILSAGAIGPGLLAATRAFGDKTGVEVLIEWATTPVIRERIAAGTTVDLLIVPPAAAEDFAAARKADNQAHVYLGRVGVGIAARNDAQQPDVSTTAALKQALLQAESVVINRASSGIYMETLLERLGVKQAITHKLLRLDDGPIMMRHLINGQGYEFGFCASIEILLYRDKGLRLVGLLPEDIQQYTTYVALPMDAAPNAPGARALLEYFQSEESRRIFAAQGIT